MFGFIHECIRQLVLRKYGKDVWKSVLEKTSFEDGKENVVLHYYKDEETNRLVDATALVVGLSVEEIWEAFGGFLIQYTLETGWDELMRAISEDLRGFLDNLDALHYFIDHVVYKANLTGPSFRCNQEEDGTLTLHYFSKRSGLFPIVKGVVREVSRRVFGLEINMTLMGRTQTAQVTEAGTHLEEHVVFKIQILAQPKGDSQQDVKSAFGSTGSTGSTMVKMEQMLYQGALQLTTRDFAIVFPYHIVIDEQMTVIHCGSGVISLGVTAGTQINDVAKMLRPQIPFTFDAIRNFINAIFILAIYLPKMDEPIKNEKLRLKGSMIVLEDKKTLLFLGSPYFTSIRELLDADVYLSNLPLHDVTRDLILLNQQRLSEVELHKKLEQTTSDLKEMAAQLEAEKAKTENLLKEVLPVSVALQLKQGKTVDAAEFAEVTVLFSDVPQFQNIVNQCKPIDIVRMLNDLFRRFDRLVGLHNVYKVETIGDSYMIACGVPEMSEDHCERVCNVALGMIWEGKSVPDPVKRVPLQVRVGIHTGPIVAGVVGKMMPRYCLFGDTVNTASRMESHGEPHKIHMSESACEAAQRTGRFIFQERGYITVKGKGQMFTYFLLGSKKRSLWELIALERNEDQTIDGYEELNDDSSYGSVSRRTNNNNNSSLNNQSILHSDGPVASMLNSRRDVRLSQMSQLNLHQPTTSHNNSHSSHATEGSNSKSCCLQ